MGEFKGAQVESDLHLIPAFEPFWHSPRVPAGATSAIFEFVVYQHCSFLIHDFECDWLWTLPALLSARRVECGKWDQ
jgi:hypothetical protein